MGFLGCFFFRTGRLTCPTMSPLTLETARDVAAFVISAANHTWPQLKLPVPCAALSPHHHAERPALHPCLSCPRAPAFHTTSHSLSLSHSKLYFSACFFFLQLPVPTHLSLLSPFPTVCLSVFFLFFLLFLQTL